jgi:putative transposase
VKTQNPPARRRYPSDLTDDEWALVESELSDPQWYPNLQKPQHPPREFLNAILYRTRTGVSWRSLPHDFPPWSTVFKWYMRWSRDGDLDRMHDRLRERVRQAEGRQSAPTAAILDSQSVKCTDVGGPTGFDAGKKGKRSQAASAR